MCLKVSVFLLLASLAFCHGNVPTDAEVEEAFKDLEKQLNDRAELKQMIKEIKDEVKKGPDYASNALGMAKSLARAVPKLKSDNPLTIAEGALMVISGIAENFPGGMVVATIASLVSSVIGIFTPQKVSQSYPAYQCTNAYLGCFRNVSEVFQTSYQHLCNLRVATRSASVKGNFDLKFKNLL